MSPSPPPPLAPVLVGLGTAEFEALLQWPYEDPFVRRLLKDDIPQRVQFNDCRIWMYRDGSGQVVGFGTLDVCDDYREFTAGQVHPYIPLLAKNPSVAGKGYGAAFVRHLIDEAALLACQPGRCHDVLYLDVYTSSEAAIRVYTRCGFEQVTPEPIADAKEGGKPYIVMAKRVGIATG